MAHTYAREGLLGSGKEPRQPQEAWRLVRGGSGALHVGVDYLEIFDDAHSDDEDRFLAIGPIRRGLVLVVWTERNEQEVRIISARWAMPHEAQLFAEHLEQRS